MSRYLLGGAFLAGLAALVWACTDDTGGDSLCDPGSDVFCRCRGTLEAGTKHCNDSGDGFGQCESSFGPCEEVIDDGTGGEGLNGTGGMIEPPDPGELFAACDDPDGDGPQQASPCNDGLECSQEYCTKPCESYEDCTAAGDCITFGSNNRCAPYCVDQSDCEFYADSVGCGFTGNANPPFDVVVCAQWGDQLELPPDGYPPTDTCDDDALCNLGFESTERVCGPSGCTDGCHVNEDCPSEGTCSESGGALGTCGGGTTEDIDVCPGVTITMGGSNLNVVRMGDTGATAPPSEYEGVDCTTPCLSGTSADCSFADVTEEDVYHVVFTEPGELIVNLDVEASYDSILYVRDGNCTSGQQVRCEDNPTEGAGEITDTPILVSDFDELYVMVDGFFGSTGTYTVTFDFTPQ